MEFYYPPAKAGGYSRNGSADLAHSGGIQKNMSLVKI